MPVTEIPQISIDICNRFFEAVKTLKAQKRIRGTATLARLWGVSLFSMKWAKNHPDEKRIKVEYLYYLARDFNVSLRWLFFGDGDVFTNSEEGR